MSPASSVELDVLLAQARGGDAAALNQLLEAMRPSLYTEPGRTVPAQVRARLDTSDLIQDSMLEAARSFGQFQGATVPELVAWLRAIIRHNRLDAMRQARRQRTDVGREVPLDSTPVESDTERPSQAAQANELDTVLWAAFERLPADHQEVIELRAFQGTSYVEVAATMGRTEAAVRRLFARAMIRWKQEAGQEG